jgi:hypothetical protein
MAHHDVDAIERREERLVRIELEIGEAGEELALESEHRAGEDSGDEPITASEGVEDGRVGHARIRRDLLQADPFRPHLEEPLLRRDEDRFPRFFGT